jgi:hypothetical protein
MKDFLKFRLNFKSFPTRTRSEFPFWIAESEVIPGTLRYKFPSVSKCDKKLAETANVLMLSQKFLRPTFLLAK